MYFVRAVLVYEMLAYKIVLYKSNIDIDIDFGIREIGQIIKQSSTALQTHDIARGHSGSNSTIIAHYMITSEDRNIAVWQNFPIKH